MTAAPTPRQPGRQPVPLVFGAASIGNLYREVDPDQAQEALAAAWEGGVRAFDTAPHYGLGLSERRLGEFLRTRPRSEVVVSTKVGRVLEPNPDYAGGRDLDHQFDVPNDLVRRFDPSLAGVRRSLEDSLQRLNLDHVDVLYLHDPDAYDLERGLREGLPALTRLREEGLVAQIGIGVNDAAVAARAVREADLDVVMIAGRYTLLEQPALAELLPLAIERGTSVVAAAVYNSGLLATSEPGAGAHYNYGAVPPRLLAKARELARACREHGVELPTAALQFPLRHPAVAAVAVGTSRPEAVRENLQRLRAPIPEQLWRDLAERDLIPAQPTP